MAFFFNRVLDTQEFAKLINDLPSGSISSRTIKRIKLENVSLQSNTLEDLHFKSCKWEGVDAHEKTFKNVIFEDCDFSNVNMRNAHLINVQFIKSSLTNVVMNQASLEGVKFKKSKLVSTDPNIDNSYNGIQADEILFDDCDLSGIGFYKGKAVLRFENSRLFDVNGQSLSEGSSIYFHNTKASLINFDRSTLTKLEIIDSTIDQKSKAVGGDIKNIVVKNSHLDFPMGYTSNIDSAVFEGSGDVIIGRGSNIKSTRVSNCPKGTRKVNIGGENFGEIYIENCHVSEISFSSSQGSLISIKDSSAYGMDFRNSKINHLILDNVKVTTRLKYNNSNISKFEARKITFENTIQIWNEDSNIEIKPDVVLEEKIAPK